MKVNNFFKFPVASKQSLSNPLKNSLISYWKLEEASGTRDDAISSNDLTPTNAPGNTTGRIGNALDLASASTQYLGINSNSSLVCGDIDYTIQAWVQIKDKAGPYCLLGKGDAVSFANIEYELYYSSSSDRFLFRVSTGSTFITVIDSVLGSPAINTWYHIIAGHNSSLNIIALIINGGTATTASMGASTPSTSTAQFRIGARGNATEAANARVDEVAFWKRLLTLDEISDLYNGGSGDNSWV